MKLMLSQGFIRNTFVSICLFQSVIAYATVTIPFPEQLKGWKQDSSIIVEDAEFKKLAQSKVAFKCSDTLLVPTHPQQFSKKYLSGRFSEYGKTVLKGGPSGKYKEICKIWTNSPVEANKTCLMPRRIHQAVISDLYQDRCGNIYRGFYSQVYFHDDENMGTLTSLGKTFYENPYSPFKGTGVIETYVGGTYALQANEFDFFINPTAKDLLDIKTYIQFAAQKGQFKDPITGLFNEADPKK